jgi:hypothetical protein
MKRDYFHCDVRSEAEQSVNDQNITTELSELSLFVKYEENLQRQ